MIKKYHVSTNLFNPASERYEYGLSDNNTVGLSTGAAMFYFNAAPNTNYSCKVYDEHSTFLRLYRSDYPLTKPEGRGLPYTEMVEQSTTVSPQVTINSGDSAYIWVQVSGSFYSSHGVSSVMLNTGSTALPFEPYGDSFKDWFYREYGTETETFTTLPHEVIGDGQSNLTWSMDGNMQVNGTPTPQNPITPAEVGEKTANLCSGVFVQGQIGADTGVVNSSSMRVYQFYDVTAGETYSFSSNVYIRTVYGYSGTTPVRNIRNYYNTQPQTDTFTVPSDVNRIGICLMNSGGTAIVPTDVSQAMLNKGQPMDYEPFGYKIPISFNQTTYNIYITEPLRKSLDGSNVYDELSSNGTLTRRVDENGDALATPTTEQVTVPTLTTTGTPEQFNVLTTLAPSEVSLTYHGWHEHEDTKFTT